jgi:hypothetical protein
MKPVLFTLFPRSEERVDKRSDAGVSKLADNTHHCRPFQGTDSKCRKMALAEYRFLNFG